jgi:hypothetical protein
MPTLKISDEERDRLNTISALTGGSAALGTHIQTVQDHVDIVDAGEPGKDVNAGASGKYLLSLRRHLNGANPTTVDLTTVESAGTLLSTGTSPFNLAAGDTLIVDTDGEGDEPVTFNATAGTSTGAGSPTTNMSPQPGLSTGVTGHETDMSPAAGSSWSASNPPTDMTPTVGTSVSDASPATDLSSVAGTSVGDTVPIGDLTPTAGSSISRSPPAPPATDLSSVAAISVSAASPATDMSSVAGISVSGASPATDMSSVAATSVSGANPQTDMTDNEDTKFTIAVDGEVAHEITCVWTACTTGALVAAQMQAKIQAEGDEFVSVTVDYNVSNANKYTITSGTVGNDSEVIITAGTGGYDCTDDLALGATRGVETVGHQHDNGFQIKVDGHADYHSVGCSFTDANTGTLIAAAMEASIQAEGGVFAATTVDYNVTTADKYTIISGTKGDASSVEIIASGAFSCTDDLKIGVADGGTETAGHQHDTKVKITVDGHGDVHEVVCDFTDANTGTLIATELQGKIQAEGAPFDIVTVDYNVTTANKYTLRSGTKGDASVVTVTNGTAPNASDDLKIGAANGGAETAGHQHDTKFKIQVDGDTQEEITCDFTDANTGTLIAAEMQSKIQAKGGSKAAVTVVYGSGAYTITSATTGKDSAVVVANGTAPNVADDLLIGVANGGNDVVGNWKDQMRVNIDDAGAQHLTFDWATGGGVGVCNTPTKIAAEIQRVIRLVGSGGYALATCTYGNSRYTVTSGTVGDSSSVVVTDGDDDITENLRFGVDDGGSETGGHQHDTKFKIRADGDTVEEVTCVFTTCTTGALIAAEMQSKIQAKGGSKAAVTVGYAASLYTITSATSGSASAIVITNGDSVNVADDLKIGAGNGGTETAGKWNTKFKIQVDGDTSEEVTCDWATGGGVGVCNTSTKIAAEMQRVIGLLGGSKANVTVAYLGPTFPNYTITSATKGTSSTVVITNATSDNVADDLTIGIANGGGESAGHQHDTKLKVAVDGGAATEFTFDWTAGGGCDTGSKVAAQMQTVIQAGGGVYAAVTVDYNVTAVNAYVVTSGSKATGSAIVITPGATLNCADDLGLGAAENGIEQGRVCMGQYIKIAIDDGAATELDCADWLTATTGSNTATWLQTKIQALGGAAAAVTVAYSGGVYVITTGTKGTGSAIVVTNPAGSNATLALKIGVANAGVEVAGTGDCVSIGAITATEIKDKLNANVTNYTATVESTRVRLTSKTAGSQSSLVVNASSTADTKLGITGTDYGQDGIVLAGTFDDANYLVSATLETDTPGAKELTVYNRSVSAFDLYCETAACVDAVHLLIYGNFTPS